MIELEIKNLCLSIACDKSDPELDLEIEFI